MSEEKPQFQHPQPQSTAPASGQVFSFDRTDQQQQRDIDALEQRVQMLEIKRINFNTDILGLFQTTSSVPTQIPNSPYQQVQIYSNSGIFRLYVYDVIGQTWHYASLT